MTSLEDQARSVFLAALERAPEQWPAFLNEACGDNSELRSRVQQLLHAHQGLGSIHVGEPPTGAIDHPSVAEGLGTVIGPYKLLQKLGEGGMGAVFLAEQDEPVQRQVALKVVKAGLDTAHVLARFEAERQALALMDHPNIAKVLDAGATENGRPFFIMELIKWIPITKYCDQEHLSPLERLALFIPVCEAVQHAHQKGIIHRDLKPSNILIALYDGKPVPKIIDFGVAKAAGRKLTDRTMFTEIGQLVGTIEYMAPEQAELNNLDIDTRADIYSLGVILYELLAGSPPFTSKQLRGAAFDEMLRIIREVEPPKPSTRLSSSEELPSIAANRKLEPKRLTKLVHGELDWIAMKCLEKERGRRYETANGLAADIQRYLVDEPVQAGPPRAAYRLRKFVRRNRRAVFAGSFLLLALIVGVVGTTIAMILAKTERDAKDRALASEQRIAYFRRVALAQHEFEGYNLGRADQLLDECPEKLRGWEWHYLQRLRYGSPPPLKHTEPITGVAVSPNGRLIASASADKTVKIWDATTGRYRTLEEQAERVWCVAFSPDGLRLASGGRAALPDDQTAKPNRFFTPATRVGQIKIWDVTTREVILPILGHGGDVTKVAFSPDGRWLASASTDGTVKIWDSQTGVERQTLRGHAEWVMDVTFSRDGRHLATASRDKTVRTWDAGTGHQIHAFEGHREWASGVAFSHDGQRLASAGYDSTVRIWDLNTRDSIILVNPCPTMAVAFSPDGQRLASAGWDKTVKTWDPETGEEILTLRGHAQAVTALAFSGDRDGQRLVSGSDDRTVRLWDATPLSSRLPFERFTLRHTDSVSALAYTRDGRLLASAGLGQTVSIWDPNTGQHQGDLCGHTGMIWGIAFSPDGRRLASASWDKTVKVWDTSTRKCTCTLSHDAEALAAAFTPDGRYLASSSYDGIVKIWDAETGNFDRSFNVDYSPPINALTYSPDGKLLITGSEDGLLRVFDADCDIERSFSPLRGHSDCVQGVAFSPDGKFIASASYDGTAKIWDAKAGRLIRTLQGDSKQRVPGVAYSPNSKYLATAGLDGTVRIWGVDTGDELRTLRGHNSMVWCVAFGPDGNQLAAGGGHYGKGDIKVWDVTALDLDSANHNK